MEITEVRVKLVEKSKERLRAFCSVTFDGAFVVRDLKVIGSGTGDGVFVAMPSRKLCDRCPRCRAKNHLRARFCNECGHSLGDRRATRDSHGRSKIHADVAHPINTECREMIQSAVIKAYDEELERSRLPDYRPPKFDEIDEAFIEDLDTPGTAEPEDQSVSPEEADSGDQAEGLEDDAQKNESAFSDYDSLIADLKKEAATRQDRRKDKHSAYRREPAPTAQHAVASKGQQAPEGARSDRRSDDERRGHSPSARHPDPCRKQPQAAASRQEPIADQPVQPPPAAPEAPSPERREPEPDDVFGAGLN